MHTHSRKKITTSGEGEEFQRGILRISLSSCAQDAQLILYGPCRRGAEASCGALVGRQD